MSVAVEHDGPWSLEEVLALPESSTHQRVELLHGALVMTPAPGFRQRSSRRLANLLPADLVRV
jgi:Uma2 family endonuclease